MGSNITLPSDIDTTSRRPRSAIGFDAQSGVQASADRTRRVLLVGQRTAAGSIAANVVKDLLRQSDSADWFGPGSSIDLAALAAFQADSRVKLSAIAVDDIGGGVKATQDITFATNAAVDCACTISVGNRDIVFAVHAADTPTVIAAAARDAINADASLGFTATSALGVLTITWKQKGTVGNGVPVSAAFSVSTAVVGTTATPGGASLATGATDPEIDDALAAVAGTRYHLVVALFSDATNAGDAKTHVNDQGGSETQLGELAVVAINDTLSTATTLAAALNGPRNLVFAIKGSASHYIEIAAAVAAVMSGETDPARPYNTLPLPGIAPPAVADRWTRSEQDTLLNGGCSPLLVGPGEVVYIQRAVVTYNKNAQNLPDFSQFDVTVIQSFDAVRDDLNLMFSTHYPRAKWADDNNDNLPPDVATPAKVKGDVMAVLRSEERAGILQNVDALADQVDVQKDGSECVFSVPADIIEGLQEIFGKVVLIRNSLAG